MARLGEIQTRSGDTEMKQVMQYVQQLEEQVRYALQNLDGENLISGAVGEKQLSGTVQGSIQAANEAAQEAKEAARRTGAAVNRIAAEIATKATKADGSLPFRVYIGTERPAGGGILWIRPGEEENGAMKCDTYYIEEEETT